MKEKFVTIEGTSEFIEYTSEYGRRVKERFPGFNAIFNKWQHEDLVPQLSDIDSRIICDDSNISGWMTLDKAIGEIHLEMVCERPDWSRMSEHNPGIALSVDELCDESVYVTDMRQWSFYYGDKAVNQMMNDYLANKPWSIADEFFHLSKFVYYYAPYDHDIDPAINIQEDKIMDYALHSRIMHYFIPALMCAVSIIDKKTYCGKLEMLRRCIELYPDEAILDKVMNMIQKEYNVPESTDIDKRDLFEKECFDFLGKILNEKVLCCIESVEAQYRDSVEGLKQAVSKRQASPLMIISDTVRFARTRAGRYYFYLNAPDFFDTALLLNRHETHWLKTLFTAKPFQAYGQLKWQDENFDAKHILDRIEGDIITVQEKRVAEEIFDIAWNQFANKNTDIRKVFSRAHDIFRDYYIVLDKIFEDAKNLA